MSRMQNIPEQFPCAAGHQHLVEENKCSFVIHFLHNVHFFQVRGLFYQPSICSVQTTLLIPQGTISSPGQHKFDHMINMINMLILYITATLKTLKDTVEWNKKGGQK